MVSGRTISIGNCAAFTLTPQLTPAAIPMTLVIGSPIFNATGPAGDTAAWSLTVTLTRCSLPMSSAGCPDEDRREGSSLINFLHICLVVKT
jgi:hypothetical protein